MEINLTNQTDIKYCEDKDMNQYFYSKKYDIMLYKSNLIWYLISLESFPHPQLIEKKYPEGMMIVWQHNVSDAISFSEQRDFFKELSKEYGVRIGVMDLDKKYNKITAFTKYEWGKEIDTDVEVNK